MTSFKDFSQTHLEPINTYLASCIDWSFNDERASLQEAVSHSFLAPGKRIRPLLAIATYQLFDSDVRKIYPLCAALEMIHTYSLIHDDLPCMDDDDLRRGLPTCHTVYGEDVALLAGDTLNTLAFELMARELPQSFSPTAVLKAISELGKASGTDGMIGGQLLDIKGNQALGAAYLKQMHALKTGALITSSVTIPALLAESDTQLLSQFGASIGLLFQVVDDILDVTADQSVLGKTPKKDIEQEKLTYVSLLGLDGAQIEAKACFDQALSCLEALEHDTSTLEMITHFIYSRKK